VLISEQVYIQTEQFKQQFSSLGDANHLLTSTRKLSVWLLRPPDETRVDRCKYKPLSSRNSRAACLTSPLNF